jgi:endonuclease-3 related protein
MDFELSAIYRLFFDHYGPQGWWPLLSWHEKGSNPTMRGRLTGYHPSNYDLPENEQEMFEIMLGAILTQNTSWVNAEKALWALNDQEFLSISRLKELDPSSIAPLIKSSGYYNQKAIKIKALIDFLLKNPISRLIKEKDVQKLRKELLEIKGVGSETADSILLYSLKKPIFVVDAYTRRLLSRMKIIEGKETYEEIQSLFHQEIQGDKAIYNEFHALIVQHCVHVCSSKPNCSECVFESKCPKNIVVKPKKKAKNLQ